MRVSKGRLVGAIGALGALVVALALAAWACLPPPPGSAVPSAGVTAGAPPVVEEHHESHEGSGEATKVEILLGEFFFQVEGQPKNAPIVLEAGKTYELEFKNVGTMLHEVMLGRTVKYENGWPHGYQENLLEDVEVVVEGKMAVAGQPRTFEVELEGLEELELEPGVALEVKVTIPADRKGRWEMGCFVPGHYEAGMKAPVIVK